MTSPNRVYLEENVRRSLPTTFAEQFLEEPIPEKRLIEDMKSKYDSLNTYQGTSPVPIPTFCTFRGIPLIDDVDWFW